MPLTYVQESERSEFETVLRNRNLLLDDFDISDTPQTLASGFAVPRAVVSTVTVRSRLNKTERIYLTGSSFSIAPLGGGSVQWVVEFAADLDAGIFDDAPAQ